MLPPRQQTNCSDRVRTWPAGDLRCPHRWVGPLVRKEGTRSGGRSLVAAAEAQTSAGDSSVPRLKRVLSAWDLILYGVVAVTPSAPATVFGLAETKSHGFAVVTILASMVAMVLTAVSYGRMA